MILFLGFIKVHLINHSRLRFFYLITINIKNCYPDSRGDMRHKYSSMQTFLLYTLLTHLEFDAVDVPLEVHTGVANGHDSSFVMCMLALPQL